MEAEADMVPVVNAMPSEQKITLASHLSVEESTRFFSLCADSISVVDESSKKENAPKVKR
jgi:hypothetical protein